MHLNEKGLSMPDNDRILRDQLVAFLRGAEAHLDFASAFKDFPEEHFGTVPDGAPHSAWQLLEHIRFTLHDLLVFSTDSHYAAPAWPDDYWVKQTAPPSRKAWLESVKAVEEDLEEFEKLVMNSDSNLYANIPWGDGQNLLREVLLAGDHTSYHVGQVVILKKQLTAGKK
jgi:hypothetical protein